MPASFGTGDLSGGWDCVDRRDLPGAAQRSLQSQLTVFRVGGGSSWTRSILWEDFLAQAKSCIATGRLEADELDSKLEIGREVSQAREAVRTNADGWEDLVTSGLENYLVYYVNKSKLQDWMKEKGDDARHVLWNFWKPEQDVSDRFKTICPHLPMSGAGTQANMVSILLMGIDTQKFPSIQKEGFW